MAFDPDVSPDAGDAAVPADEESGALDAHVFPPVERLLDPDAVGVDRLVPRIGGKHQREIVFPLEAVVGLHRVGRDADDGRAGRREIGEAGGEIGRFERAALGIILRIKIENDRPALEAGEADPTAAVGLEVEIGSLRAFQGLCHAAFLSSHFAGLTSTIGPARASALRLAGGRARPAGSPVAESAAGGCDLSGNDGVFAVDHGRRARA